MNPPARGAIISVRSSTEPRPSTQEQRPQGDAPRRGRRTTVLAVLGGLAIGLLVAFVGARLLDDGSTTDATADGPDNRIAPDEVDAPADLLPDDLPIPDGAGATTPEAALTGFLDAEVAKDFETSFGYLDASGRATFGSPAGWVSAHASELAPITSYDILETTTDGDSRALIDTDVTFTPGLDQVIGLTPQNATATWNVNRSDDGTWGVTLDTSAVQPIYPADDGVTPAIESWVAARQSCEVPDNEFGTVVGSRSLATQLCDADGTVTVGPVEALDEISGQPVFTAFGPEAVTAGRTARLSGPVELAIIVVPIGDAWTVIGVLP